MQALFQTVYAKTPQQIAQAVEEMEDADVVAIDTETTGLDTFRDIIISWSFCTRPDKAWMLDRDALEYFDYIFSDPDRRWYFHNYKYDIKVLRRAGHDVVGTIYDTMILDWLEDENKRGRKLGDVGNRHVQISKTSFDKTFGTARSDAVGEFLRALEEDPARAAAYAAKDAWLTWKAGEVLRKKLSMPSEKNGGTNLLKFYEDHLQDILKISCDMEVNGMFIDTIHLSELEKEFEAKMANVLKKIFVVVGRNINIKSTKQLADYFFGDGKIEPVKLTKGGAPSTDEEVLSKLAAAGNTVASLVLEYRGLAKLQSTYVVGMKKFIHPDTGRIHTTLRLDGTVTGRFSSSDPNLQNIPARTEEGKRIREAFIPGPGNVYIVSDYSQVEMRILAHFSEDPAMIDIIRSGKDLHSGTASLMFGVPYEDIAEAKKADNPTARQKELLSYRRMSKTIGFGLLYGMGVQKLAIDLGVPRKEAAKLRDAFFRPLPSVQQWIENVKNRCHTMLMVKTILGRPRRLPTIQSAHVGTRKEAERQAVNSIIQGSAADIVFLAMRRCAHSEELKRLDARMLMQIHDELIFEVPEDNAEEAKDLIEELMTNPGITLRVPLDVSIDIGYSWAEAK